jgi:hypothetical protein
MRIIETKVYKIDEHPNKDYCYVWIRNNWHDLNEHELYDIIESLKALQNIIGGKLDYSISCIPHRGEYISLIGYDKEELNSLSLDAELTGSSWDYWVIKAFKENNTQNILRLLHDSTEYAYSDESLYELCMNVEYEFTINGECI